MRYLLLVCLLLLNACEPAPPTNYPPRPAFVMTVAQFQRPQLR